MQIIKVNDDSSAKLFSKKKDSGDDIIVFFYAEWCGHCKAMKDDWKKFIQKAPSNLNIAEIESEHIKKLETDPKVRGFPTIKYYNKGNEEEFNDERTADNLLKFVNKHLSQSSNKRPTRLVSKKPTLKPTLKPTPPIVNNNDIIVNSNATLVENAPNLNDLIANVKEEDVVNMEPGVLNNDTMQKIKNHSQILNNILENRALNKTESVLGRGTANVIGNKLAKRTSRRKSGSRKSRSRKSRRIRKTSQRLKYFGKQDYKGKKRTKTESSPRIQAPFGKLSQQKTKRISRKKPVVKSPRKTKTVKKNNPCPQPGYVPKEEPKRKEWANKDWKKGRKGRRGQKGSRGKRGRRGPRPQQ